MSSQSQKRPGTIKGDKMKAKLLAGLISALCITGAVQAQNNDWPSQKVIRLIAVFPPGGSVDQVARILAPT